ncbi:MAG: hypothetical protein FWC20_04835 [Oscillospiraceae bacterium]|nr:hypothetical protein [Oscillospiraceae bacterium]MCL2278719.1 hypothetical protein [Oscillospiraceae bacterium]
MKFTDLFGKDDVPTLISEARNRVEILFGGELQSDPIFIISDNPATIRRTGDNAHVQSFRNPVNPSTRP